MSSLLRIEVLVLELLLIVSLVAIGVRRFRIPYTVALVLVGAALSLRSGLDVHLTPDLLLTLLLPPLVFEAAFHINVEAVRRNLSTLVLFAVVGVVLTMGIVGGVLALGTEIPPAAALVFGALIAATDPVAVVAVIRRLGVAKRLEVLLEGESLLNDGTAIVLFSLALANLTTGGTDLVQNLIDFVRISAGGLAVGLILGWIAARLIQRIDDYLVETTLTTVLAFGSYLVADQLHVSGVLAVVAAGLINGNLGPQGMSPTTRIVVLNFWEYVAFLANSAVFLLIGLEIDIPQLLANGREILWAIAGVLLSRMVVVYGLSFLSGKIPWRWRHVLFWGGLRGAIALALALSLPEAMGGLRTTFTSLAFGVVLFSLVGQGLTMTPLVKRLGLVERDEQQVEYERRHARALSARAAQHHLARLHRDGLLSSHAWDRLEPLLEQRAGALTEAVGEIMREAPKIEAEEIDTAQREGLRAARGRLASLRRDGVVRDDVYEELVAEIDSALETGPAGWFGFTGRRVEEPVVHLILAVVQRRDQESASNALTARGARVTVLHSAGGFLGQGNSTLLIGLPPGRLDEAVEMLAQTCRSRVEYVTTPMAEIPQLSLGEPVAVTVRGATVFVFPVERYEEF